jgi:hypothetical protein
MWTECKYRLNELLNLEVDENEGFALQRFRFSNWEKALPTNWIEIWVGPTGCLDVLKMRKPFVPAENSYNKTSLL